MLGKTSLTSKRGGDHRSVKEKSGPPLSLMNTGAGPGHPQPHVPRK